jgi:prostaglandin-E synthase 1
MRLMPSLIADPSFKIYAVCCAILSMQMLVLAGMTPAKRAKAKKFINPEDSKVSFAGASVLDGAEDPATARVARAHRNMNESLPIFFGLGILFVLAGGPPLGAKICFIGFTAARVFHSVAYLNALQPWRTISYAIGAFSLIGLAVMIVMAAVA